MYLSCNTWLLPLFLQDDLKGQSGRDLGMKLLYDWIKQRTPQQDTAKMTCKVIWITSGGQSNQHVRYLAGKLMTLQINPWTKQDTYLYVIHMKEQMPLTLTLTIIATSSCSSGIRHSQWFLYMAQDIFFSQPKVRHKKRSFGLFSSCKCFACNKMGEISFSLCSANAVLRCQTPEVSEGRQKIIYNHLSLCYYLFDSPQMSGGYFKLGHQKCKCKWADLHI